MDRLKGKVALISGGSGGIGAATAQVFCFEGAKVLLIDCDPAALETKARAIRQISASFEVETCGADVAAEVDAQKAIASAINRFGAVDVVVNKRRFEFPGL